MNITKEYKEITDLKIPFSKTEIKIAFDFLSRREWGSLEEIIFSDIIAISNVCDFLDIECSSNEKTIEEIEDGFDEGTVNLIGGLRQTMVWYAKGKVVDESGQNTWRNLKRTAEAMRCHYGNNFRSVISK